MDYILPLIFVIPMIFGFATGYYKKIESEEKNINGFEFCGFLKLGFDSMTPLLEIVNFIYYAFWIFILIVVGDHDAWDAIFFSIMTILYLAPKYISIAYHKHMHTKSCTLLDQCRICNKNKSPELLEEKVFPDEIYQRKTTKVNRL